MKKQIMLLVCALFLMTNTCFAIEKGDRIYGDLYFESAKIVSKKPDVIIKAKIKSQAKGDGSYTIFTYEINRSNEEMTLKLIETFVKGNRRVVETNDKCVYSHLQKSEQIGRAHV